MAFDKASQFVFITLQDSNEILAIDLKTQQPLWKLPVGPTPAGIHMTPDDKYLLVGIMGADYVEVIDWRARKSIKKIVTAKAAHNFLARGDGRHVFVSNRTVNGSISLVDMQTLTEVEKYDVPGGPDDMEIRADGKELWATARFGRKVQVIDLEQKKVSHSIPVGRSPHGVSFINHAARQ
jgi:DNA-binding beta-propeller fold protein YncE